MDWISSHRIVAGLTIFAALCGIVSLVMQSVVGFLLVCVVFCLLVVTIRKLRLRNQDEPPDVEETSTDEKRWIDCAYCGGQGSVVTDYFETGLGTVIRSVRVTCGVCNGNGQLYTKLWSQSVCRRCKGSGRLESYSYVPGRIPPHFTEFTACDTCGGTGRRPSSDEESD